MGTVSTSSKESHLMFFWIRDLITVVNLWVRRRCYFILTMCGYSTFRISTGGFRQGYLGTLCTTYVYSCCVNYVACGLLCHWYIWSPKTKLEGLFRIFCLSFGVFVSFSLVLFLHLQPNQFCDIKNFYWCQIGIEKKKCVCGIFTGRKDFIWFLKPQKAPAQSSAWLLDAKGKRHPFNGWR